MSDNPQMNINNSNNEIEYEIIFEEHENNQGNIINNEED